VRFVEVTCTAAFVLFGTMLPVCAQHDEQGDRPGSKQGEAGTPEAPEKQNNW
jgi:hypothetical protein